MNIWIRALQFLSAEIAEMNLTPRTGHLHGLVSLCSTVKVWKTCVITPIAFFDPDCTARTSRGTRIKQLLVRPVFFVLFH
jgi:hypothetical protein